MFRDETTHAQTAPSAKPLQTATAAAFELRVRGATDAVVLALE